MPSLPNGLSWVIQEGYMVYWVSINSICNLLLIQILLLYPAILIWFACLLHPFFFHFRNISLIQLIFVAGRSTELSSIFCLENQLNSARFIAQKINWIQLIFLARISTYFSSFSWLENQLNSARFIVKKINWIQLVLLPRKSTEFSSFLW